MTLDRRTVVAEALRLLDDEGLDALSLRTLAARLGVQAPTLYWHVASKGALLDALADAIMDEALDAIATPASGRDGASWLLDALGQVRACMLRHRDGARVVAGARLALRRADLSELAMATLVDGGADPQRARLLVLAAERFTFGYVLEEQSATDETGVAPGPDELRRRFPIATAAIGAYFERGRSADDLFGDCARLVLNLPVDV